MNNNDLPAYIIIDEEIKLSGSYIENVHKYITLKGSIDSALNFALYNHTHDCYIHLTELKDIILPFKYILYNSTASSIDKFLNLENFYLENVAEFINFERIYFNYNIENIKDNNEIKFSYGYKPFCCIKYRLISNTTPQNNPDFINYKRNQKLNELYE
jgi:hypothetical protein